MSYTPTTWATGDTITAEKLNHLEGGVEAADGGALYLMEYNENEAGSFGTVSGVKAALESGKIPVLAHTSYGDTSPQYETMIKFIEGTGGNKAMIMFGNNQYESSTTDADSPFEPYQG